MLLLQGHTAPVYSVAFSPDSVWLASGAKDGRVLVHDPAGGAEEKFLGGGLAACTCVGFHPGGELVVGYGFKVLSVPAVGLPVTRAEARQSPAGFAFLDEKVLAVGFGDRAKPGGGSLGLVDYPSARPRPPQFAEPAGVKAVAAHIGSRAVAWANGTRRVSVWQVQKPEAVHFNLTHSSPALAFHPDGTAVAAAIENGVRLLELGSRRERLALKGHRGTVSAVAFSPDGRTLATGSWDDTVRLWDPADGSLRATFQWPTGRVLAVAFSPDGTRLAAGGATGTVVVWDVE